MTAPQHPQEHCGHECVCPVYQRNSEIAALDGFNCKRNHEGCKTCEHDTRTHSSPAAAPVPDEFDCRYYPKCSIGAELLYCPKKAGKKDCDQYISMLQHDEQTRQQVREKVLNEAIRRAWNAAGKYHQEEGGDIRAVVEMLESLRREGERK